MRDDAKHPRIATLVGLIIVVAALYLAKDILVLFAIAFLFAFLLAPLAMKFQRLGLPRVPSVLLSLTLALALVGALGWLVLGEANQLLDKLPQYEDNLRQK